MLKLFSLRSQSVKQASAILAVTALLSNGLGLARNLIFYRVINPAQLDTYFASFRIADFLFNILIFGAITSAVIPIMSGLASKKEHEKAVAVTNQLLSWASLTIVILIALLALVMPFLVDHIVPGFDRERSDATVLLSRLLLLQTLFFSWSFIIGALLNGYSRFTTYALAPLFYNISLIVGGFLAGTYGVIALVYAVVIGSFFHFLIQYVESKRLGFSARIDFRITPELKTIVRLMIPRSFSQGIGQIVLIAYTTLASRLQPGSIAIFSGMNDLQTTPTVIVANSLATASFPALSAQAAKQEWQKMDELLTKVLRVSLFVLLPTIVLGFILRAQIVRLYFGLGSANWDLTTLAITTFAFFIIGIIPSAIVAILARVFYATHDTKTPMIINFITSFLGITTATVGIQHFHYTVATLAFSESLIMTSQAILYLIILNKRGYLSISLKKTIRYLSSYLFGSLILGFTTWIALRGIDWLYESTNILSTSRISGLFLQTMIAAAIGIFSYFRYSTITSNQELQWLKKRDFSRDQ